MGFDDVLKKSFVQTTADNVSRGGVILALLVACLLAVYIFCVYRIMTRKACHEKRKYYAPSADIVCSCLYK